MGSWILLAITAAGCLFLGYQSIVLEGELEQLSDRVGEQQHEQESPEDGAESGKTPVSQSERLFALEEKASELRGRVELAKLQTAIASGSSRQVISRAFYSEDLENTILDVVKREQEQMLDEQLSLIQQQLVAGREGGLALLTQLADLTQAERLSLDALLKTEAQQLVDIFRDADLREDPEAAVEKIRTVMERTDAQARTMLDDEKTKLYLLGRAHERRMLMPWLDAPER